MLFDKYQLVAADSSDADDTEYAASKHRPPSIERWQRAIITLVLSASLITNVILLYERSFPSQSSHCDSASQHAHLSHNVPMDMHPPDVYGNINRTIQDAAWDDPRLVSASLFVALDEQYTISQGLPHSQRWPWDTSKGVYIPLAAHELHCVQVLRSHVNEVKDGLPEEEQTWSYFHLMHCLNTLRESVMCNADDRLMYTGQLHDNIHHKDSIPGRGAIKMCRNWDDLVDWAHANSACYARVEYGNENFPELERYKYCPDKSRPWEDLKDVPP